MSNDPDADMCSECGSWRDLEWRGLSRLCACCIAEHEQETERRDEYDMAVTQRMDSAARTSIPTAHPADGDG